MPYQELTDPEIVARALQHKEEFSLLIDRYEEKLGRYLRRLGVHAIEDREDLLQDIFLKVYKNLNDFDTALSFSAWLYRIAHNEAVSFFRRTSARPSFPESALIKEGEELLLLIKDSNDFVEELEGNINAAHLMRALNALDEKYKNIIILRFFEEYDYKDISDVLQIPIGTVATLIARAKNKLRETLSHII